MPLRLRVRALEAMEGVQGSPAYPGRIQTACTGLQWPS